jgi:hypothetical protein
LYIYCKDGEEERGGEKEGSLKIIVLIPTSRLQVPAYPPFLRYMPTDQGVRRSSSSHRQHGAGIMPQYCTDIYHSYMGIVSMHQNEFQMSHRTALSM